MRNILHISDIHFTSEASILKDAATAFSNGILGLVDELLLKNTLSSNTLLFITGDLVQTGNSLNFDILNEQLLKPLIKKLDINVTQVYICPGNHEIDREAISQDDYITAASYITNKKCEQDIYNELITKLNHYFEFIDKNGYKSVTRSHPRMNCFELSKSENIIIFNGLVGSYSRQGTGDKGELFIAHSEISNQLSLIPKNSIVLTHHPIDWYADESARILKRVLSEKQCRLFTGHIHNTGAEYLEIKTGGLAIVQSGAAADGAKTNEVAVAWASTSNSVAVRHYSFNPDSAAFKMSGIEDNQYLPPNSNEYFSRTIACFDIGKLKSSKGVAAKNALDGLLNYYGLEYDKYIFPDIALFKEDEYSATKKTKEQFFEDKNNKIICGDDLSGKSSLLQYIVCFLNKDETNSKLHMNIDYRSLDSGRMSLKQEIIKKLASLNFSNSEANFLLDNNIVELWIDNYDSSDKSREQELKQFIDEYPKLKWTLAVKGSSRFTPTFAPVTFSHLQISYYEITEITLNTALKFIEQIDGKSLNIQPRAIVERTFRSINNLKATRSAFYVKNLVDLFINDASVEPLNRYLLIENLLEERIRYSHKALLPNSPLDKNLIDTFIGCLAHAMFKKHDSYITKAEFYSVAAEFSDRKGLRNKDFNPDIILKILEKSYIIREVEGQYCFVMISIEDYFLAKHMERDDEFKNYVMSEDGLLSMSNVAEYYIAETPYDKTKISKVFDIIENFKKEVSPFVEELGDAPLNAIKSARKGGHIPIESELLDEICKLDSQNEDTKIISRAPKAIGSTGRLKFEYEDRGAVFLQLGASVLGLSRSLDMVDRIEIFNKLKDLLNICISAAPFISDHLASGGEIIVRGTPIKAEYVGALANAEDRYYIILRGLIYNIVRNFATWSGSPSFYMTAEKLNTNNENEIVRAALFAQNIVADLTEAVKNIKFISQEIEFIVIKEVLYRLYVDAMAFVPLDSKTQESAINELVDATITLRDAAKDKSSFTIDVMKGKLKKELMEKIGLGYHVGKVLRPKIKKDKKRK